MTRRQLEGATFGFCAVLVLPLVVALARVEDLSGGAASPSPQPSAVIHAPGYSAASAVEPVHTANIAERR